MDTQSTIWTIGHSNRSIYEFLDLLMSVGIETVIDCRTKPKSMWPHFNAKQLYAYLECMGIDYELRGHNLGGLGENVDYKITLNELVGRSQAGERLVLLCSEGKPEQCHRGTVLAPELEDLGLKVEHLVYK